MKVRAAFCGMIFLLAVMAVLSSSASPNGVSASTKTGSTHTTHTHPITITTFTTIPYTSNWWWPGPCYGYSCYPYPCYGSGCYPYPAPSYPYVTTQTVTSFSAWTETDYTTSTVTSVPSPVTSTVTSTTVTTDTTIEAVLGGLTALFAALFLAAVILLAGTRHRQQPSQPRPALQANVRPGYVCDACGAEVEQTAKFCVKCGAQLRRE